MLSELQQEQIAHYFNVVLDQDRNGILEEKDFVDIGESLCILWRFEPSTEEYDRVMNQCRASWKMFENYFSKQEGAADVNQFLKFSEKMLTEESDEMYQKFVVRVVSDVFDSFDLNEDGVISINEYVEMFMCYNIPVKYSAKAFLKLDRNGDNQVSKEELLQAVDEFFKSDDESSPGNWLFGFWGDRD